MPTFTPAAHDVLSDRSDRARLLVEGPDRGRFLHNVTTNDVKRLIPGQGREAFVTSLQGKTLGHVTLHALTSSILLRTDQGGLEAVLPHFQKYGLFDDVAWRELTDASEAHVAGPRAAALLARVGLDPPGPEDLAVSETTRDGASTWLVRECPTGLPGWTVIGSRGLVENLRREAKALGIAETAPSTFDALRIAAGTPAFGRDVTTNNLPQEVGRDRQAINFVKGCYLGQETVARIDALGHVNRILKGLRLDHIVPVGTELLEGDKVVGSVTSVAESPELGPIALAYVRTAQAAPGTVLQIDHGGQRGAARVVDLPMGVTTT